MRSLGGPGRSVRELSQPESDQLLGRIWREGAVISGSATDQHRLKRGVGNWLGEKMSSACSRTTSRLRGILPARLAVLVRVIGAIPARHSFKSCDWWRALPLRRSRLALRMSLIHKSGCTVASTFRGRLILKWRPLTILKRCCPLQNCGPEFHFN